MVLRKRNESIRVKEFYTIEFWLKSITRISATATQALVSSPRDRCPNKHPRYTNFQRRTQHREHSF